MRQLTTLLFALVVTTLLFPTSLRAQDIASMTGVVTDASGASLPQVSITLVNTKTNAHYDAKTNNQGSYRFVNVTPGPGYKATFTENGFTTLTVSDLYLNVATTRTQNVTLQVGAASEQVDVVGSSQNVTIDTTDATVGNNFDVKLVNELPVQSRGTPAALFTLQPGVTLDGAVTGARTDQNNVTVDGLDVNDFGTGDAFAITANAPVDSVQEFRGTVAGNLSNSGPGGGGQFQLVTKSGTNTFHGNLNEYHRDTATKANEWFNNNGGVPRSPIIQNQFGGSIGGPIRRDKLFFFFNYFNSRIIQSSQEMRVVPLDSFRNGNISYIKAKDASGNVCGTDSRQNNTPQCIGAVDAAGIRALDPQHIGTNAGFQEFINKRYPHANDLTGGDGVNTGAVRFNAPSPDFTTNYVGKLDYNLTSKMKIFGRFTVQRENNIYNPVQFSGDPVTSPFIDRSYAYVFGHTWTISSNKVNQFTYGKTVQDWSWPITYNPQGKSILTFDNGLMTSLLDNPYMSPGVQARVVPIPVIADDFTWQKGAHTFDFGGTFKFIKTYQENKEDYNTVTIGMGGNTPGLDSTLRPRDILTESTASNIYDSAFAVALGRVANIRTNYNFDNKGNVLAQGTGSIRKYRYFQTQLYFGDTWRVAPSLTLSYGANYQLFSVPYETQGLEAVQPFTFDQYFSARVVQSATGQSGNSAVPLITYVPGGKANKGSGYYKPSYKDIAPRFAFAYSPASDRKTVFSGGAGVVYDRTVISALQYYQDRFSYLFEQINNTPYGTSEDAAASLASDPRLGVNNAVPAIAPPAAVSSPYQPFVDSTGSLGGLANGHAWNSVIDPSFKTPYSIAFNAGFQHEFPEQFVLKATYVGRLGRRLLAQVDANQVIDFADQTSGQLLSEAFGNITRQMRAGVTADAVAAQPWFENQVGAGATKGLYNSSSAGLISNGDFADFVQALAHGHDIKPNIGMGSQFSENTFYTNKGSSNYHGLLATLQKNMSHGLQFDLNYTWSHSIDNVSLIANKEAGNNPGGFICDARNIRLCRGNSDFDTTHYVSADFTYSLPFGRGRTFGAKSPIWLNEAIGGWDISGITQWHTGVAFSTLSSAYVAGYSNNAAAIFNGDSAAIKTHVHRGKDGSVNLFADPQRARGAFSGPVGFNIGSRNSLRGPGFFNQNLGLAKTFPLIGDRVNLKFRADAFNAFNHPNFATPNSLGDPITGSTDITTGNFGQITRTIKANGSHSDTARIMQFALRLEF